MALLDYVKWGALLLGGYFLYSLAQSGGLQGKIFVLIVLGIGAFFYWRDRQEKKVVNSVAAYYSKLIALCKLNRNPTLKNLVMCGDRSTQRFLKGRITGGALAQKGNVFLFKTEQEPIMAQVPVMGDDGQPLIEERPALDEQGNPKLGEDGKPLMEKAMVMEERQAVDEQGNPVFRQVTKERRVLNDKTGMEELDSRADRYVFTYTTQFGILYDLPIIGWIMTKYFRHDNLITIKKSLLKSKYLYGDVEVEGINTDMVGFMEYVVDTSFDKDAEYKLLTQEVERETLLDNLIMLKQRIRWATDSNSWHQRGLDSKDTQI